MLRGVFTKLVVAGLKLKPKKCESFKSKIAYLGHIVSSKGIETDLKKVEAVKIWTVPKQSQMSKVFLDSLIITGDLSKTMPRL